jgi:hypothetical protein
MLPVDVTTSRDTMVNRKRIRVQFGDLLVPGPWPEDVVSYVERLTAEFMPRWLVYEQIAASCHDQSLADRIRAQRQ